MHEDFLKLKKNYDSIDLPPELDLTIENAIRRGKKTKRIRRSIRPLTTAAALLLAFVLTVNLSPAFARYVSKVPGMEALVDLISSDRGLVDVVEHGYGQVIDKSVTDNGIRLTVESAIYDGRKLIIAYELKSPELTRPDLQQLRFTDNQGGRIACITGITMYAPIRRDSDLLVGLVEIETNGTALPDQLILDCAAIEDFCDNADGSQREVIAGNWSIPFTLDRELARIEPKRIEIEREAAVGDVVFTIKSMTVYPTVIDMELELDADNPLRFTGFKNPRIIDGDGNELTFKSSHRRGHESILSFESNYFISRGSLTFVFDGVYTMPLEETYFILDIEKEAVVEDCGLAIEFLRKNTNPHDEEFGLEVWYKINDAEVLAAEEQFVWIERVVDFSGSEYNPSFLQAYPPGGDEFAIGFRADRDLPTLVKVIIGGLPKGIMEAGEIKLN